VVVRGRGARGAVARGEVAGEARGVAGQAAAVTLVQALRGGTWDKGARVQAGSRG
jgi:hypothetical protein